MFILNVDPADELSRVHISFFTTAESDKISLWEVEEIFFRHPEARNEALISKIDIRKLKTVSRTSMDAGSIVLLEAAQNNTRLSEKINVT